MVEVKTAVAADEPGPQVRVWYWNPVEKACRYFTMPLKDFESVVERVETGSMVHITEDGKWKFSVPAKSIVMVEAFDE